MRGSLVGLAAAVALLAPALSGAQPVRGTQPVRAAAPAVLPAQTPGSVKILVNKDGWYKVTKAQLEADGFAYPVAPPDRYKLHLYKAGTTEVPLRVRRNWIEFYGEGLDNRYTDTQTYWLVTGSLGAPRIPNVRATTLPDSPTGTFQFTATVKERLFRRSTIVNGEAENWFGLSTSTSPTTNVQVGNVDTGQGSSLEVKMRSLPGATFNTHTTHAVVNNVDLGSRTWTGDGEGTLTWAVPAGLVGPGTNTVKVTPPDAGTSGGVVDTVKLTYPHFFLADNNSLVFSATAGTPVTVGGFTGPDIRMIDISNPLSPRELTPSIDTAAFKATLNPPDGTTEVLAFLSSGIPAPKDVLMDTPSNLQGMTGKTLLVISHADFLDEVAPLVAFRDSPAGGDWSVVSTDVQDVYDEFAGGARGPQAIIDFLQQATTSNPNLKHVLLVGDASDDSRGYCVGNPSCPFQSLANAERLPTTWVDSSVSDPTHAAEGPYDDGLAPTAVGSRGLVVPTMAVGRLPARTEADVTLMVDKIMRYQLRGVKAPRDALLVSDNDGSYPFYSFSIELQGTLQEATVNPPIPNVNHIVRDMANPTGTRAAIISAANAGPTIVNWYGHGGSGRWTTAPIFSSTDAAALTNDCPNSADCPLSLYLMMTCLNGLFTEPVVDEGLAEVLVKSPGGAVASWSSAGSTFPGDAPSVLNGHRAQRVAANVALDQLIRSGTKTLGQAMLAAKNDLTDYDVMRTWILFGDPTTTLR